jgi:hypothetical protein
MEDGVGVTGMDPVSWIPFAAAARFIAGLNALLVAMTIVTGIAGNTPRGTALWLTLAALLGINGVWHLQATVRGRRYSPGVVTGILLYVPMAVGGFTRMLSTGRATAGTALTSAATGAAYWIWSEWRKRRVEASRVR